MSRLAIHRVARGGRVATLFSALLLVLLVAGCTETSEGVGSASGVDSSPTTDTDGDTVDASRSDDSLAGFDFDAHVAETAAGYRLDDPPEVEFERFVHPDEWATVQVACLGDFGFLAEARADGGISQPLVPDEQADAKREANFICKSKYPTHPRFLEPLSDDQIRLIYRHALDVADCLEAEGYATPPPPSVEAFISSYRALADNPPWDPFSSLPIEMPQDEWLRLQQACPPLPPVDVLYPPDG